ncbi:MAG: PKD domain-containing protein, partial [Saprospiraceae bacterium]
KSFVITEPKLLTANLTGLDEKCDNSNGFISIVAAGGTTPYVYYLGNLKSNNGSFSKLKGGTYLVKVEDANKCLVQDNITIYATHNPKVSITASGNITCLKDTIDLDGQQSDNGSEFITQWTTRNGKIIGDPYSLYISTAKAGTYQLKITNTLNTCVSIDSSVIKVDKKYPNIKTEGKADLNCIIPSTILIGSTKDSAVQIYWTKLNTNFKQKTANINVDLAGDYVFNVQDTINKCLSKDTVQIKADKVEPIVLIENANILNCLTKQTLLDASHSDQGNPFTLQWFSNDGHFESGQNTLKPNVDSPGTYVLRIKNNVNGCETSQAIQVVQDIVMPAVQFDNLFDISCKNNSLELSIPVTNERDYEFHWSTQNGHIVGADNLNKVEIDRGGSYSIQLKNKINYCEQKTNFELREQKKLEALFDFKKNNLEVQFSDLTSGITQRRIWSFGDGSTSSETNPVHQYSVEAEYEVCLELENECGINKSCKNISLVNSAVLNLASWDIHHISCFGASDGVVNLNVQGGIPPYNYAWSNGGTNSKITSL